MRRHDRLTTTVLGCVLLAGCSSAEPASESLPATTATTTAAPTLPPLGPADFPVPVEARQQTAEGAAAFAEYYVDLISYTTRTLDSSGIRQLSRDCEDCEQVADGADTARAQGLRFLGGELTITSAGAPYMGAGTSEVAFLVEQAPLQVVDASGATVPSRSSDAYGLNGGVALNWAPESTCWVVTVLTIDRDE
ncbi:hypothetical protein GB931_20745 [Modestobacter sp. I12A-02628]|uniref:DUF6318 domain-containing protein n=1 Tax=Goekera deserti TaxID=2497753 RepID=A0A7K3W9Y3_9ACTN|nr:DUF6318 family protein [Goekera deserti]MPR00302.1 hypothetical protein [Goekera deserti]NDI49476.1 hypothetical protein [Goekera deserti]NEL52650.1 hypothetical protein [Goekera deserti]